MQLHLPRPFIPSGFLPICQSANLPIHPSTWPRRPFTLDTRQLAPTRRTRRLSRGHSIVTQPAPFLPPTKPQSEPVPFLCCSLAWNALGLLTDCRLAYPNSTHTSRDRHPVQPWTRGPLDQTTQIAIHTYIHTLSYALRPPFASRQPTRSRSFRSRLRLTPLRLTTKLRVSPGFLLPVDPPVRHPPTASRLPGDGSEGTTRTPALPPGLTIHEPCTALQLAAPRVL